MITTLSAAKLEAAIAAQDEVVRAQVDAMINAGRGHETMSDIRAAAQHGFDPQAWDYCREMDKENALRHESERRMTYHGNLRPIKVAA